MIISDDNRTVMMQEAALYVLRTRSVEEAMNVFMEVRVQLLCHVQAKFLHFEKRINNSATKKGKRDRILIKIVYKSSRVYANFLSVCMG